MMALAAAALAGLVAGAIHVLAGVDHLAAVAPLAAAGRGRAWTVGFRWGLGHAASVALVGATALVLRGALPLDGLSSWSERLVGATLIAIGLWALLAVVHPGRHPHRHLHAHPHGGRHLHDAPRTDRAGSAALAVGALHGTAGAGHVFGVLPAFALPGLSAAAVYLVSFGAGTVTAMTAYAVAIATVRRRTVGVRAQAGLLAGSGAASIAVGILWLTR